MRILYITDVAPWNPKFGGSLRNYNILKGILRSNEVTVGLASDNQANVNYFRSAADPCFTRLRVLGSIPKGDKESRLQIVNIAKRMFYRYQCRTAFRSSFLKLLRDTNPDVVWYASKYCLRSVGLIDSTHTILDMCDVESVKMMRSSKLQHGVKSIRALAKAFMTKLEENWLVRNVDRLLIANPDELKNMPDSKKIRILPNGFDFSELQLPGRTRMSRRMLFIGSLFYHPNIDGLQWFCSDVWPCIRQSYPDAELDVVGHYEAGMDNLIRTPGVTFHGFTEDTSSFFVNDVCLIVPLRIGAGTRLKILEAWAKGLPVVTTTIGSEGLNVVNRETALVADNAIDFAHACVELLDSPRLGDELACKSASYGKRYFDWTHLYAIIDDVLNSLSGTSVR